MELNTNYLGLTLRSPLVVGAAQPLTEDLGNLPAMAEAGAGAIVLHSLFEEQIVQEVQDLHRHLEQGTHSYPEALTYAPQLQTYVVGPELYLEHVERAKRQVPIPIIASLNGTTPGGWVRYAREIEAAGADALELNLYAVQSNPERSSSEIEADYLRVVESVRREIRIPLAVKLSPYFTGLSHFALACHRAGANGLVLFNRFYQPDIDIESLTVSPNLILSGAQDLRLPLHWMALLHGRFPGSLAATGGVQHPADAIKLIMAGADVVQTVGALLRHGPGRLRELEHGLRHWLMDHGYNSLDQLRGSMSQRRCPDPVSYERVNYLREIQTYTPHWHRWESVEPLGTE